MLASSSSSRNKVVKGANGLLSQVIESIRDHEIKKNVLLLQDIQSRVEKIKEKAHGNAINMLISLKLKSILIITHYP